LIEISPLDFTRLFDARMELDQSSAVIISERAAGERLRIYLLARPVVSFACRISFWIQQMRYLIYKPMGKFLIDY